MSTDDVEKSPSPETDAPVQPERSPIDSLTGREPLADYCMSVVIHHIRSGLLEPGAWINVEKLARELNVSPTPLRESLPRLEAEGFVVKNANRGFSVASLVNGNGFDNAFAMRALLEPEAAHLSAQNCSTETLDKLAASIVIFEQIAQDVANGEIHPLHRELTHADAIFHDLVADNCGNDLLSQSIHRMRAHLHLHAYPFTHEEAHDVAREHTLILDALRQRDSEAAHAAMKLHITAARERMRSFYPA